MLGLRVHVPERSSSTPVGEFTCRCGATRRARGDRDIAALISGGALPDPEAEIEDDDED